jgi:hypothetical protein
MVADDGDTVIAGDGLIVMLYEDVVPVQPFAVGVITMVAVIGVAPVFVAVKEGIFPDPLAARPMAVLLFVQVNVVPATGPVRVFKGTFAPLQ